MRFLLLHFLHPCAGLVQIVGLIHRNFNFNQSSVDINFSKLSESKNTVKPH